jgi:hypothetical protein
MILTLYLYRARPGQKQAILSLCQEWQLLLGDRCEISAEFYLNCTDACDFLMLSRFKDEETAWVATETKEYRAWYSRLARLTCEGPIVSHYQPMPLENIERSNP